MRTLCLALLSHLLIASAQASNGLTGQIIDSVHAQPGKNDPPNVVLILADDLGFSDIASYGSEINTPSLSALAELGVSFTNYHTAANCAPARAMLLTGVDAHLAGVPNIPEMLAPEQQQTIRTYVRLAVAQQPGLRWPIDIRVCCNLRCFKHQEIVT